MMQGADARQAATKADEVTTSSGPPPINLGDQAGLKRGLDDCAVAVSCNSQSGMSVAIHRYHT